MKKTGFLITGLSVFLIFSAFFVILYQNPVSASAMRTDFDDESGGGI